MLTAVESLQEFFDVEKNAYKITYIYPVYNHGCIHLYTQENVLMSGNCKQGYLNTDSTSIDLYLDFINWQKNKILTIVYTLNISIST